MPPVLKSIFIFRTLTPSEHNEVVDKSVVEEEKVFLHKEISGSLGLAMLKINQF